MSSATNIDNATMRDVNAYEVIEEVQNAIGQEALNEMNSQILKFNKGSQYFQKS